MIIIFSMQYKSQTNKQCKYNAILYIYVIFYEGSIHKIFIFDSSLKYNCKLQSSLSIVDLKGLALKIHNREKSIIERLSLTLVLMGKVIKRTFDLYPL